MPGYFEYTIRTHIRSVAIWNCVKKPAEQLFPQKNSPLRFDSVPPFFLQPRLKLHCWKQHLSLRTKIKGNWGQNTYCVLPSTRLHHCFTVCWPRRSHLFVDINVQPWNKGEEGDHDSSSQASSSQWTPTKKQMQQSYFKSGCQKHSHPATAGKTAESLLLVHQQSPLLERFFCHFRLHKPGGKTKRCTPLAQSICDMFSQNKGTVWQTEIFYTNRNLAQVR